MCADDMAVSNKSVFRTLGVSLLFVAGLLFCLGVTRHYDRRSEDMTPGPRVPNSLPLPPSDVLRDLSESHMFGRGSAGTHPTVEEPFFGRWL